LLEGVLFVQPVRSAFRESGCQQEGSFRRP